MTLMKIENSYNNNGLIRELMNEKTSLCSGSSTDMDEKHSLLSWMPAHNSDLGQAK